MKFLHSMIRTSDPEATERFYTQGLGLKALKKTDYPAGRFTLYFYGEGDHMPMVEITHNWDAREYSSGDQFGHLAFETPNIFQACAQLQKLGVDILRPPRDGYMAFIKDPNGISIELLQAGEALAPIEPWESMQNQGSW